MKKLMVLSLVLAVSAVSTAIPVALDVDGSPTLGLQALEAIPATSFLFGYTTGIDPVDVSRADFTAPFGKTLAMEGADMGAMIGRPDLGFMDVWLVNFIQDDVLGVPAGTHIELTYDVFGWGREDLGLGTAVILDADDPTVQYDIAYVIPEPMTIGLLGLGALFLRRRK